MNQEKSTYGYICFYNWKQYECYADSLYGAKQKAIAFFRPPVKKQHMISVMLAEKNGETVIHSTSSL